jgi:Uma2 family endonuclease
LVFADDDDVIPDIVWISRERLRRVLEGGRLRAAPELVVEVLSPGSHNARRDRVAKLDLYSRRGVDEYWLVDPVARHIEIYRRRELALHLEATLRESDAIESAMLPGFSLTVARVFVGLPAL